MATINQLKENFKEIHFTSKVKTNLKGFRLLSRSKNEVSIMSGMISTMAGLISTHQGVFTTGSVEDLRSDLVRYQKIVKLTQDELYTLFYTMFDYDGVNKITNIELMILIKRYNTYDI